MPVAGGALRARAPAEAVEPAGRGHGGGEDKGRAAALQKMVDRGEAATLEVASQLTGTRLRGSALQNMVDRGEAATPEEVISVLRRFFVLYSCTVIP